MRAEQRHRQRVAQVQPFGDQVARGGAEREGEQDGRPVEAFAAGGEDGVGMDGVRSAAYQRANVARGGR